MSLMLKNRIAFAAEDGTGGGAAPAADGGTVLGATDAPAPDAGDAPPKPEGEEAPKVEETAVVDPLDLVPEDGKYALTMPEGMEVDATLLDALAPKFKELNLTTKQANELAGVYAEKVKAEAEARQTAWNNTVNGWLEESKKDAEIGGDKWDATVTSATSVVRRFGNDAFREYLDMTGAGNHPEVIRFMAKVGAMIGEDKPAVSDGSGKAAAKDSVSVLYPDDKPKGK